MAEGNEHPFIFLVDDDEDDRHVFRKALEEVCPGIRVKIFNDASALLEYLEAGNPVPDILFLDLHMPGMDGEACLRKLREDPEFENSCVVLYSATMDMKRVDRLFAQGANRYLRKPDTIQGLKVALQRTISSCQNDPIGGLSVINCTDG